MASGGNQPSIAQLLDLGETGAASCYMPVGSRWHCLSPLESSEKYHKMEMERSVVLHRKEISHGKTRT